MGQVRKQSGDIQAAMLRHLQEITQDASHYPWANVRNYHGVVLGQMEQDELNWGDRAAIQDLRSQYARCQDTPRSFPASATATGTPPLACWQYQRGQCAHTNDHITPKGDTVRHVCAWCLRTGGKAHLHTEQDCRSKSQRFAKNGGMPATAGGTQ